MGKQFTQIEASQQEFIEAQRIFFNASACAEGHINLSPRDVAALRILDPRTVVYIDRTGSGNETAAHLLADGRLTLMFCAFDGPPMIVRLYGRGRILARGAAEYNALLASHFGAVEVPGARQMVSLDVEMVQTSCGMNVPQFDYVADREQLTRWALAKGEHGLDEYRRQKNAVSLDGFPTGMFKETPVA
jgi:hypothetical protein